MIEALLNKQFEDNLTYPHLNAPTKDPNIEKKETE